MLDKNEWQSHSMYCGETSRRNKEIRIGQVRYTGKTWRVKQTKLYIILQKNTIGNWKIFSVGREMAVLSKNMTGKLVRDTKNLSEK